MALTATEVIKNAVGEDWARLTPILQRIKMRPAFGSYQDANVGVINAQRAGIVEIKEEREQGKVGPKVRYVRIKT